MPTDALFSVQTNRKRPLRQKPPIVYMNKTLWLVKDTSPASEVTQCKALFDTKKYFTHSKSIPIKGSI